jgi:hypothetical protein
LLEALSAETITYLSWKEERHLTAYWSLNTDLGRLLTLVKSEDLPYLYWIPKLHKTPYKERYIAGSSTCSTW